MIKAKLEGKKIYQQLVYVLEKFLPEIKLSYLGGLEVDECVKNAVRSQVPYTVLCPESKVSRGIKEIALKLDRYQPRDQIGLEEFLEWLVSF